MKYYYKIVNEDGDSYISCRISHQSIDSLNTIIRAKPLHYYSEKWTEAPDKINGICIFKTLKTAKKFINDTYGASDIIFKCEAKNVRKPLYRRIIIFNHGSALSWPEGTLHADSIILIEEVK
jgi:hypothetical protein